MALQDVINTLEPSKPEDFDEVAGTVPSISSVRANFTATKNSLQGLLEAVSALALAGQFVINEASTGMVPVLIGSLRLAASTYAAPSAELGAGDPSKAATLELRKPDGTVLCTVGGSAGGVAWRTADHGFSLTAATAVDLVLYGNAAGEPVFVKGLAW